MPSLRESAVRRLEATGRTFVTIRRFDQALRSYEHHCEGIGGDLDLTDEATVVRFLSDLRQKGYSVPTLNFYYRVIRSAFRSVGLSIELDFRRQGRRPQSVLSRQDVGDLVQQARQVAKPGPVAYLALATTFGPRRSELSSIEQQDIGSGAIMIRAAKRGAWRTMQLPAEIMATLGQHVFRPLALNTMSKIWVNLMDDTIGGQPGTGFHTIRRSLATELLKAGASETAVAKFMGWSIGQQWGALPVYDWRTDEDLFRDLWPLHPFLEFWR